jgi:hypothetical protein
MSSDATLPSTQQVRTPSSQQWLLVGLFAVFGCSGLIHESTWAQLPGHAAYAQTLVLTIFMGAIGTWCCTRGTMQLRTLLLGMTFAPMTGMFLHRFANSQGRGIVALYFSNSLGAAVGVLASGFILLPAAGIIKATLSGVVYLQAKTPAWREASEPSPPPASGPDAEQASSEHTPIAPLWLVTVLTGLASVVYEIGVMRRLSMVLGASTHAFELMRSAFIFGPAPGNNPQKVRLLHSQGLAQMETRSSD